MAVLKSILCPPFLGGSYSESTSVLPRHPEITYFREQEINVSYLAAGKNSIFDFGTSLVGNVVQRSTLISAPGLVKFVPAVARLFWPALHGSFLTMLAQNKVDLCTGNRIICGTWFGELPRQNQAEEVSNHVP